MLYIKPEIFALLDTDEVGDLRKALQIAIQLEHATMPPYLYALYSLGLMNPASQGVLRAIVREEMLHMLLACNLLNAVGGKPLIDDPCFVPSYPTPLPGTIAQGLQVPLKPFSKQLVTDVFMVIEEPETPLHFPVVRAPDEEPPPRTIGIFYARIRKKINDLGPGIFTGNQNRQVTSSQFTMPIADQVVKDPASASKAIDYIVQQGEGTATSPKFDGTGQFAHYYRFEELSKGLKLQPNPNATPMTPPEQSFQFGPVLIAVDESAVLPLRVNPKSADYPAGPIRDASDNCNKIYTCVLAQLQKVFDGAPEHLDAAITMMQQDLRKATRNVTSFDLPDNTKAGPTFEYLK